MRKTLIRAFIAAAALAGLSALPAAAQNWPQRQITFISPFAPGGGTDAFARPLAAQLDTQLGHRVLIENKAGAGGTLGASFAAKAAPDGYTFLIGAAHHTIAPGLYPKLDYDIEKDFIPVGMIAMPPQVVVVHPEKVQAKTLAEFIAFVQANPDKINFASAGAGTTHHLTGELFKIQTKSKLVHIPYRGAGPAMADLLGGQIEVMFDGLGTSAAQISSGKLRALAVAAPKRNAAFPDLPTTAEAGLPGFEVSTWYAVFAPKGTPEPIVTRLQEELKKAFNAPVIKDAWVRNGSDIPDLYGSAFGAFVASEVKRWSAVVKESGAKL